MLEGKSIPMDGTLDQVRPLFRLQGQMEVYSFDLKSATDRWPLLALFDILVVLFDRMFAGAVRSCLAINRNSKSNAFL